MLRVRWDMPKQSHETIVTRDSVKNIIDYNLSKRGYLIDRMCPAQYGFGVIGRRVRSNRRLYEVQRVWVGSSNPHIASILSDIRSEDLLEVQSVDGAGLDLRKARIFTSSDWEPMDAIVGYAVSPIRVLPTENSTPRKIALHTFGNSWNQALNRTMKHRFGREFHLNFIPDVSYVRLHQGDVTARMGIKQLPDGRILTLDGVVLPFTLTGPEHDIRDAWFSGLGSATAQGFGWWEMDSTWI